MPGENIWSWSTTAANNGTADTSINWAEGMARASVNDSARSTMAAVAKWRDLTNGSITTGGTANAQTFSTGMSFTAVPTGMRVLLKVGVSNTASATLNMDSIGGVAIKNLLGNILVGGELLINSYQEFLYDGTNWIWLEPRSGNMLLDVQTVSAAGSINLITGFNSTFDDYEIELEIAPVTDNVSLYARITQDGASYKAGASDYHYSYMSVADTAAAVAAVGSTGTSQIVMAGNISNSAAHPVTGTIRTKKPSSASLAKKWRFDLEHLSNSLAFIRNAGVGSYTADTAAITGIQFFFSSGNVSSATARVYGIQK